MSRQGLTHHPNYPSARMTLGRALLDSGDLASARREFEAVLKGAADNILASRYLAECLEGLGQGAEALARYKATLALAPGDKQVQARIQALEKGAAVPEPSRPSAEDTDPAPIRLVEVDGPMELVTRYEEAIPGPGPAPAAPAEDIYIAEPAVQAPPAVAPEVAEAPVKLRPVEDGEFELERGYDAMPAMVPTPVDAVPMVIVPEEDDDPILEADADEDVAVTPQPFVTEPPAAQPARLEPDVIDEEFDVETPPVAGPPRVTFRDIVDETAAAALVAPPVASQPAPAPEPSSPEPELSSPTLAELYFDQGIPDKAIEVYRRLLQREPDNERLRARMREIEAMQGRAAVGANGPPGSRQDAIGRAIARLQDLRAALARRD